MRHSAVKQTHPDLFTIGKDYKREGNVIHITNPFLYYSFKDLLDYVDDLATAFTAENSKSARDVDEKYLQDLRDTNSLVRAEIQRRTKLREKLPAETLAKRIDYYYLA